MGAPFHTVAERQRMRTKRPGLWPAWMARRGVSRAIAARVLGRIAYMLGNN